MLWVDWQNDYYFQSVANPLRLTQSEATELLISLRVNHSTQQTTTPPDHTLSCAPALSWLTVWLLVYYFQSVANLLGLTKSEATELLTSLSGNQSTQQTTSSPAHTLPSFTPLCITAFLGCFECASVTQQNKETDDTRFDNKAGTSGAGSTIPVAIRKGLSSDMTVQLGKLTTLQHSTPIPTSSPVIFPPLPFSLGKALGTR